MGTSVWKQTDWNMIYTTWDSFKQSVYRRLWKKGVKLSSSEWKFLEDELFFGAIHSPFDDVDALDAVDRALEIRKLNDKR